MAARKLLTLHAPMARALALPVLRCVETKIKDKRGVTVWLSAEDLPDVVVMADLGDDDDS